MRLKKMSAIALTLMLSIGLAACSSGGSGTAGGNAGTGEPGAAQSEGGGANTPETAGGTTITVLNEGAVGIGVGVLNDLLEKKKQSLIKDETQNPRIAEEDFSYTPGQPLKKSRRIPVLLPIDHHR